MVAKCKLRVCTNRNSPYSSHLIRVNYRFVLTVIHLTPLTSCPNNPHITITLTWLLIPYYLVSSCKPSFEGSPVKVLVPKSANESVTWVLHRLCGLRHLLRALLAVKFLKLQILPFQLLHLRLSRSRRSPDAHSLSSKYVFGDLSRDTPFPSKRSSPHIFLFQLFLAVFYVS